MKKIIVLLLFSIGAFGQTGVTHISKKSGNWSDASTWNTNTVPTAANSRVLISKGCVVVVDTNVVVDSVWIAYFAELRWKNNKSLNNVSHHVFKDNVYNPTRTNIRNGEFDESNLSFGSIWSGNTIPSILDRVLIADYSFVTVNVNVNVSRWFCDVNGGFVINVGKSLNKIKRLKWED